MKLLIPHVALEKVMYALHRAEVPCLLLQHTGPGWILEMFDFPEVEQAHLISLGAQQL